MCLKPVGGQEERACSFTELDLPVDGHVVNINLNMTDMYDFWTTTGERHQAKQRVRGYVEALKLRIKMRRKIDREIEKRKQDGGELDDDDYELAKALVLMGYDAYLG